MTAKPLEQRFATPGEVLSELQSLIATFDMADHKQKVPPLVTRRQWLPLAAWVGIGSVLTLVAWSWFGSSLFSGVGAANRTRVLVMLPRQGLWFPDYQSLVVGAQNTGTELVFAG